MFTTDLKVTKLFIAIFINMAVTSLIAFGTAQNVPSILADYNIFTGMVCYYFHELVAVIRWNLFITITILQHSTSGLGPYNDFTTGWYGNVGFFLVITFILSTLGPIVQVHCT